MLHPTSPHLGVTFLAEGPPHFNKHTDIVGHYREGHRAPSWTRPTRPNGRAFECQTHALTGLSENSFRKLGLGPAPVILLMQEIQNSQGSRRKSVPYPLYIPSLIVTFFLFLSYFLVMHKFMVEKETTPTDWRSAMATEQLNDAQLSKFISIRTGAITKSDVEIVIAKYTEDETWSDVYSNIRTIYDKSQNAEGGSREAGRVFMLNVGRESLVYLRHIVENYNNLSQLTVFTHGEAPTVGYEGHRRGGGHIPSGYSFHDYVLADQLAGLVLFTSSLRLPTLAHAVHPMPTTKSAGTGYVCPDLLKPPKTFEFPLWLHHDIVKLCHIQNAKYCSPDLFWNKFVKLPRPDFNIIFFAQGARLAVTKQQIRRRPRREYAELMQLVSSDVDPWAGFFLEWFWYPLLTSRLPMCNPKPSTFGWSKMSHDFFKERNMNAGNWRKPNNETLFI